MNKEVTCILRKVKKQGARLEKRNGHVRVHGERGFYIVHLTPSQGGTIAMLRKELRRIGFRV